MPAMFALNWKKVRPLLALAILTAFACEGDPLAPKSSQVQIFLTDAPHEQLESAFVWISQVYLQGGGGAEPDTAASDTTSATGGRVDLYNDPAAPLEFDLLTLRDGVTADLTGLVEVDVGLYQSLRFVVDSARVTLVEGLTFEDGTNSAALRVPSGNTSGIKVKLHDVLDAEESTATTVTVDFDVDDNFKIQENPQTGLVKEVRFTPVLKEKSRNKSGG
jgi:hypothetical protein